MQLVGLHGFATDSRIWHFQDLDLAPNINFYDIESESLKLASYLNPDSILVGWSMGGMVAIRTAVLGKDKIKALVLVSTTPKFVRSGDCDFGLPEVLIQRLIKKIKNEGVGAFHSLIFKNDRPEGLVDVPAQQAKKEMEALAKLDLRDLLPEIKIPTLIIHGSKDEICLPAAAKYMHKMITNNEVIILEGIGHAPMIEAPGLFNFQLQCFIQKYVQ